MSNTVRFLVLVIVLLLLSGLAATLQLRAHHLGRKHIAKAGDNSAMVIAAHAIQSDQQRIFLLMVAASLTAVVAIALVPATRRDSSVDDLARVQSDMSQMNHLARVTVAQANALTQERDARIRTEETLHREQVRLNQALEEKIQLGRNLHDGIIQSLYATGLTLEAARQNRDTQPAEADALLERGVKLLNTTIREVRGYIDVLGHSPQVGVTGLKMEWLHILEDMRAHRTTAFSIHVDESAERQLSSDQRGQLLQILREAASNSLRHGNAQHLTVRLHEDGTRLALLIQDDGCGFDLPRPPSSGLGLANLRARTIHLEGNFELTSQSGAGTRIVITFPTAHPA